MQKPWVKKLACVALCSLFAGTAFAQNVSDEDMQSIKQYCDEMNGFGAFASEEERLQAVRNCIDEEVGRASQNYSPEETGNPDKVE